MISSRIAIIDLGTNSVRFDAHQLYEDGDYDTLFREKLMVRLGQDVFTKGRLSSAAVQRTVHAFLEFSKVIESLHVTRVIAFGTSALRESADADRLVGAVRKESGIEIKVISGEEEARLIALGILSNEKLNTGSRKFALVDIGGGSTEVSICHKKSVLQSVSLPLGTARLQQIYLKKSPPSQAALQRMREDIRNCIEAAQKKKEWPAVDLVVGSSGTVRALAKTLGEKDGQFKRKSLIALNEQMSTMTTGELLMIPKMDAKRVDMILAGSVLLEECARALCAKKIRATEYSLRDGIIQEQSQLSKKNAGTSLAAHLADLLVWAKRFGVKDDRARDAIQLASALYELTAPLHRMGHFWAAYLFAAVVLRKTGESISSVGHGAHTAYIIRNAGFPYMEDWEVNLISELCRLCDRTIHRSPDKKELRKLGLVPQFTKLLALLSVVDAMDLDPQPLCNLQKASLKKGTLYLRCRGLSESGLEVIRVQQRSQLFREVFGKKIALVEPRKKI